MSTPFTAKLRWLLIGTGIGAASMYLLDPRSGRRRRAEHADQFGALVRDARDTAEEQAEHFADRAAGTALEATEGFRQHAPEDDRTLADKVRSEVLGQKRFKPFTVNVEAHDGVVVLRGQLDDRDLARALVTATSDVTGVQRVESFLHPPGEPAPNVAEVRTSARA